MVGSVVRVSCVHEFPVRCRCDLPIEILVMIQSKKSGKFTDQYNHRVGNDSIMCHCKVQNQQVRRKRVVG